MGIILKAFKIAFLFNFGYRNCLEVHSKNHFPDILPQTLGLVRQFTSQFIAKYGNREDQWISDRSYGDP